MTEKYRPDGQGKNSTRALSYPKIGYQKEGMAEVPTETPVVRMTLQQYLALQGRKYHPSMLIKQEGESGVNGHNNDLSTLANHDGRRD